MAETKPSSSVAVKNPSSVQPKKSSNSISWLAPLLCIILGYVIWRFILGAPGNFAHPDPNGGFWPQHKDPKGTLTKMYEGGIIVPVLIGCFLLVVTFCIERFMKGTKNAGTGSSSDLVRHVQGNRANTEVDKDWADSAQPKEDEGREVQDSSRR